MSIPFTRFLVQPSSEIIRPRRIQRTNVLHRRNEKINGRYTRQSIAAIKGKVADVVPLKRARNRLLRIVKRRRTGAMNADADERMRCAPGTRLDCMESYLYFCPHCQIGFQKQPLYSLHMGLHCVDQPWKCNMCGKAYSGVYEFNAHALHFWWGGRVETSAMELRKYFEAY